MVTATNAVGTGTQVLVIRKRRLATVTATLSATNAARVGSAPLAITAYR